MSRLSLEEHIANAEDIKNAVDLIRKVWGRSNAFPKSSRVQKCLYAVLDKKIPAIKSELDNDYHALISEDDFKELGHIYYGPKRGETC